MTRDGEIHLKYDKQATDWLLQNIEGRPVVLEATVNVYRWGSRVSVITGLPHGGRLGLARKAAALGLRSPGRPSPP